MSLLISKIPAGVVETRLAASPRRVFLLIAKGFDGVEVGGANGRDHTADQSDGGEDEDGYQQGGGVDGEADVARFGVFGHGAVERQSAHGKSDSVGEDDAEESTDEGDGERLGQKLEEDVTASGAQRFLYADFARALGDGDEHDVHQANAADAKGEGADEAEQDLEAEGDDLEMMEPIHKIHDKQRARSEEHTSE